MHLFLTSSPCDDNVPNGVNLPCIFFEENSFVKNLQKCISAGMNFLVIAADPDNFELNDEMTETFVSCFAYHGMKFSSVELCDSRTFMHIEEMILRSDVIMLAGGHVPTQNAFFEKINLAYLLRNYEGVVMGVSAGSMNCASVVYAQPEMAGESIDPDYRRFISGLALTDINILPHYQQVRDYMLDGKRLYEDITFSDSVGKEFIAIPDGSYILQEKSKATLYGEGYRITNACIEKICSCGESVAIR